MHTAQEVLQQCTIDGLVVKLPVIQLDRKLYQEVAKALELIGGKWKGGKVFGFVFTEDPTELLAEIASGEKRNLKKEFQFFGTPTELAKHVAQLADIKDGHAVLEPSAGQGALIQAVLNTGVRCTIGYVEMMPTNIIVLSKMFKNTHPNVYCIRCNDADFLQINTAHKYNRIVANPPFAKNQDIDHVYKMWEVLKPGGRIVSIVSTHWKLCDNKKESQFRSWLREINAQIQDVPQGIFKESGTNVATCILIIDKP